MAFAVRARPVASLTITANLFDDFKSNVVKLRSNLEKQVMENLAAYNNKEFAQASMAMCALVAAADGTIDSKERVRTAEFIMSNPMLQHFNLDELKEKYDYYCDKMEADFEFGSIEAISAISKLKKKEDQARAVLQVGIVIGGADGNFSKEEKDVVRRACFALGIDPKEFGLF
eukprot:jgi/Mesvir1/4010/Mv03703-RA.1